MSTITAETTAAETITYRKTKSGEWVAFGPATAVVAQQYADITKRSGDVKRVWIESVGKTFEVDGTDYRYGYIGRPLNWLDRVGRRQQVPAYARCRGYGETGAVEQTLETYEVCSKTYDF